MSILPPELDANYEVLEETRQEGGMGAVFKARHRHLDEPCVIKVMHPRLNDVSSARDRFFREAKRGKQLRHPNIAEVQAFFVGTDGKAYLVMEYVDGQNLRDLLTERGALDPKLVITIGVQALSALACVHAHQIVHRDISPDNLMLTKDAAGAPLVKLIDLGIAKALDETMSLTGTGSFIGKVHYAPPEQFRGTVDARSDLYSLGVVLYELATGARPVAETDTRAIIAATINDPPRPFSETDRSGRVPRALRAVILKALEKKPENRFQTAQELAQALQGALAADRTTVVDQVPATEPMTAPAGSPAPATVREPAPPIVRQPSPRRFTLAWIATAAVLFLVIGALAASQILRKTDDLPARSAPTSAAAMPAGTSITVARPETLTLLDTVAPQETVTPERHQSAAQAITRGKRLAQEKKIGDAYAAFSEATRADPNDAFAWANFGGAAAVMGKDDEARAAYDRALAVDPANWLAHYNLACLLTGSGAKDEAMKHLETAVSQLRLGARSREELAAVLTSIRKDEALRTLRNDSAFTKLLAMD
jgi:tRNA A-37 threonylcarbamoyl transferase component Bud32